MTPRHSASPTAAEIEILRVLWKTGPSTVAGVHQELQRKTGYTTVLKLMQIMAAKGLLRRDTHQRAHIYHPAVPEEQTKKGLVHDLLEKVFSGSARDLILQALSARRASPEELAEIKQMIQELEKGEK
jgi:predicted transcriptional regulator